MTRNEPTYREKGRALFLAAMMVLSVVAMSAAFVGGAAAAVNDSGEVEYNDWGSDDDFWQGQEVTFADLSGDNSEVGTVEAVGLVEGTAASEGDAIETFRVSDDSITIGSEITQDLDGAYHLRLEGTDGVERSSTMWWVTQEVDFKLSASSLQEGDNTGVALEWSEDNRDDSLDLEISSPDLSDEDVAEVFGQTTFEDQNVDDSSVVDNADFSSLTPGEYTFEIDLDNSTASDTVEFEVIEDLEGDVNFGNVEDTPTGDEMQIPIQFDEPAAYAGEKVGFTIGEDDGDYAADIEVTFADDFDQDEIVINWNTYNAGQGDIGDVDDVFTSDNDGVEDITFANDGEADVDYRLNSSYTFSLYDEGDEGLDWNNRVSYQTAMITDRTTGDASVSIAPNVADIEGLDDLEDLSQEDLQTLLDAETDDNVLASGDTVIVEQDVNGIFGYAFADDNTFTDDSGIDFTVSASDDGVGDLDDEDFTIVPVQDDEKVYFVYNVDGTGLGEDTDGVNWNVEFNVTEKNDYIENSGEDEDDNSEVSTTGYIVTERTASLDLVESPYQIVNSEDGVITGTTTVAPGSTIDFTVQMDGVFLNEQTVTVSDNRTFEYTDPANFADREEGDEVDITFSATGIDEEAVDGIFSDTPESESNTTLEALADLLGVDIDEWYPSNGFLEQINDLEDVLGVEEGSILSNLSDLQDERNSLQEELGSLEDERDTLQDELDEANSTISDLEGQISDLEDERDAAQDEVSSLEDEISTLESQVSDLQDENGNYEDEISNLESQISDLEDERDAAQDEVSSLEDEISTLEDDLETAEEERDTAQSDLSDAEDEISSLEDEISSLEDEISTLEDDLETAEEERDAAQSDLDEINSTLDDSEYDSIQDAIDAADSAGADEGNESDDDGNESDDDSSGDDGTPGFGIAVALSALLGAAMLAIRRQN